MAPSVFSLEQLKQHDGSNPDKPLYICVKGIVFDVSKSREFYGPGTSLFRSCFAYIDWYGGAATHSLELLSCLFCS